MIASQNNRNMHEDENRKQVTIKNKHNRLKQKGPSC